MPGPTPGPRATEEQSVTTVGASGAGRRVSSSSGGGGRPESRRRLRRGRPAGGAASGRGAQGGQEGPGPLRAALSPGQVLQDLLLDDPGHAGAASRVESKWAVWPPQP